MTSVIECTGWIPVADTSPKLAWVLLTLREYQPKIGQTLKTPTNPAAINGPKMAHILSSMGQHVPTLYRNQPDLAGNLRIPSFNFFVSHLGFPSSPFSFALCSFSISVTPFLKGNLSKKIKGKNNFYLKQQHRHNTQHLRKMCGSWRSKS